MEQKVNLTDESNWAEQKAKILVELDHFYKEQKEVALMLDQSRVDVNKLAQRNASITAHLQQIQTQFDRLPREDIRMAYDSALDAQQRLFIMRGQVEKLQSENSHLQRAIDVLELAARAFENGPAVRGNGRNAGMPLETVEVAILSQEVERQRLSRQMHDGPAQALSNFILQTEIAMRLFDIDQTKAKDELENLRTSAANTFRKVRDFIFELRPMMLDDLGLPPTLKRYIEALKAQAKVNILLSITGSERRLVSYEEVMIFRAIQELLGNAVRHSQATQLKVRLDMGEETVHVVVDDDGKGFDLEALPDEVGAGLRIIRDRVEMLGGEINLESTPGQGTRVSFQVPALIQP